MFLLLIRTRMRMLRNGTRDAWRNKRWQTVTFSAGGLILCVAIFAGFQLLFALASPDKQRDLIAQIFYFLFLFLLTSAVPFVAGTLLQGKEFLLLGSAPIQQPAVISARLIDATISNSVQFAVIGAPAILASSLTLHLPLLGWLLLPLLLALFILLPALVTALVLLAALTVLGMKRLRRAIAVANGLMACLVCFTLVGQAGRIQLHDNVRGLSAYVGQAYSGGTGASPTAPFTQALFELADGRFSGALSHLLIAAALVALLFAACVAWGARTLSASSLADDETPAPTTQGNGAIRPSRHGLLSTFSSPVAALIAKDLRYVCRDSVLISQLGMPAILFFVPLILGAQHRSTSIGQIGPGDLYPFAIAMTGVIVFMQTSILSLSSIGLEGQGFWMLLTSPNGAWRLLWAKFVTSTAVSAGIGIVLSICSGILFGASPLATAIHCVFVTLISAALCGLGVGVSAALPRFVYENPAHRVSASAMVISFFATMGYLAVAGILALLTWHLATLSAEQSTLIYSIGISLVLILSLCVMILPLIVGARRIGQYQWEH